MDVFEAKRVNDASNCEQCANPLLKGLHTCAVRPSDFGAWESRGGKWTRLR